MPAHHDLVIRNGTIVDGTGAAPRDGDVAISDGRITAVGKVAGSGRDEIDARGKLVSPGFVETPLTAGNRHPMPALISAEQADL